ncbi:hypothetical protein [Fibrobacter sp.]|uniref:hypothetical protein n=1 Tax=Fibrobacter sp. TaxID=35828 RepID=UPI0025B9165B|nr:hypothetical protein [Fibrobacter sp.]MBS7272305.1 hypothetical protein [Fibrobacter sp.]MCI6436423.1 hypothetical protein [Fibrobacter sp.]MDD7498004.1 hypothetical protein [Fibrobacter sp.]MDY5723880.1 hypothetical protein [Fibrobacter sp.]
MKKILISVVCLALFASFSFAQESLSVYKKNRGQIDENTPVGSLLFTDYIKELPIPMDSVKKVTVVKEKVVVKDKKGRVKKDKKGNPKTKMQRKRVVTWEKVQPSEPPRFVPIQCKLGEVWVKRADLARFKQASLDLSGEYASSTGSVILKKSPTNPRYFSFIIQNGPFGGRAELEASNVELRESNGHARLTYTEDGCTVDIAIADRKVRVAQRGCSEYNVGNYKLEGEYNTYKGNRRVVETFNMPEQSFKYKKYLWCGSGFDSCEKVKDDNGTVTITWSKDGNGFIERAAGEDSHIYRPFEHVIPHKRDFYNGEKPLAIKTKRTDMAGEWMIWYFYPQAQRFKMVRAGMREDTAYMEIYE